MHPVISAALDAICLERDDQKYSASFDAVVAVVREFGERDLANVLFSEIPRTVPFELVAELFDLLAWQTNDNGASVSRALTKAEAGAERHLADAATAARPGCPMRLPEWRRGPRTAHMRCKLRSGEQSELLHARGTIYK